MDYIDKNDVKAIRNKLKSEFPNYKFSVRKQDSISVYVSLLSSDINFYDGSLDSKNNRGEPLPFDGHEQINTHRASLYPKHEKFFQKVIDIMKTAPKGGNGCNGKDGWYDKSDHNIDYFDTAYYIHFHIGVGGGEKYKYIPCNEMTDKSR